METMVPDMDQVPMSAPTERRISIAPMATETPSVTASLISDHGCPIQRPMRAATILAKRRATWFAPSEDTSPKRKMERASKPTSITTGRAASKRVGGRTLLLFRLIINS